MSPKPVIPAGSFLAAIALVFVKLITMMILPTVVMLAVIRILIMSSMISRMTKTMSESTLLNKSKLITNRLKCW